MTAAGQRSLWLRGRRGQGDTGQRRAVVEELVLEGGVARRGVYLPGPLVVEVTSGHPGRRIVADRQPGLGDRREREVVGGTWPAHLCGHPAWFERVRLRISAQLVDTHTDFPLWSERFDREMKDVFEVQDEMARKIAEALRVTLSPQELEALADKPTENLQAYDQYLRGKRYARRLTRQDVEFALQMFENAVGLDPSFALAYAASANACAMYYSFFSRDAIWVERAREASARAVALRWDLPETFISQAWVLYAAGLYDEAVRMVKKAIERKRDCDGAYYLADVARFLRLAARRK